MTDSKLKNSNHAVGRLKITLVVILAAMVIYLFIALFTFNINDAGWSSISSETVTKNSAGPVGAYIASFILAIFGVIGFLMPFLLIDFIRALLLSRKEQKLSYLMFTIKTVGIIAVILSCCGLAELYLSFANYWVPQRSGGIIGYEVVKPLVKYSGLVGGSFSLVIMLFVGLTLYCGTVWLQLIKSSALSTSKIARYIAKAISYITKAKATEDKNSPKFDDFEDFKATTNLATSNQSTSIPINNLENDYNSNDDFQQQSEDDVFKEILSKAKTDNELTFEDKKPIAEIAPKQVITKTSPAITKPAEKKQTAYKATNNLNKDSLPSIDLLFEPEAKKVTVSQQELNDTSALLEQTLNDFNISAKVVGAYPGPVITRFEIDLARGTKVSKLVGISQDLARALSTASVRVVEVIPGKPFVGLELPNAIRQMVRIKEVLGCPEFMNSKAPTMMGIGVDISGKPAFAELAKMPHLLVAGTTGSGKSVGVNSMIVSMLYKCMPDELKFIMIDPKMLELSIYDGIPHLLTPVVTDMTEAANSLRWCVKEMERRYALMSAAGVRNIALLNDKIEQAEKAGTPLKDTMFIKMNPERVHEAPTLTKMPYIVVVADEFADMIMVVGKKVEELIARLAQKARAAGIHIILATQRPSADVVTGLIKANIPTRMSFQVSGKIDSRIMLDQQGAEQLLGMGDMLYLKPGLGAPMRIHGAFVEDDEVHRIVDKWKEFGEPEYIESILETSEDGGEGSSSGGDGNSEDPLYNDAVEIVIKSQKASISAVQRKLKIGYNRSARLMEEMEENGIVSEMNQNGMRDVLINRES
ncbi:DNA translocase FtsK 4TM domain-containing protein [Francisellaceae bacterium CB299]|jgi:S-DNA-T family DNA segregation ATPase FtsK/SpoIIIE